MTLLTLWLPFLLIFTACTHNNQKPGSNHNRFYHWNNPPEVGQVKTSNEDIPLGGLSGLCCAKKDGHLLHFTSITDRGPNGEANRKIRPFLYPQFIPEILEMTLNLKSGEWKVDKRTPLLDKAGNPMSGLPIPPSNNRQDETAVDIKGLPLGTQENGLDSEGLCRWHDGSYWVGDEYGPDLLHFSPNGRLIERYSPGKGLPEILRKRKVNRGFEGVACTVDKVYAILQSPLPLPEAKNQVVVRIIEFSPEKEVTTGMYIHLLSDSAVDKIGDLTYREDLRFWQIEQNEKVGPESIHNIYEIDLKKAHNLVLEPISVEPELLPLEKLKELSAPKKLIRNLVKAGMDFAEKLEGLAVLDDGTILVISDNDFSLQHPVEGRHIDPRKRTTLGILSH